MIRSFKRVNLNKWQIALLVGTPLLVGTSYYIYKRSQAAGLDKTGEKQVIETSGNKAEANATELEINKKRAELEHEELTPLKEAQLFKTQGNECFKNGKYDEAINFYDKAIAKCPKEHKNDMAIFYQNRAAAYEMLKKWRCVKEDCTSSLEYNPRYTKAYYRRAKAHEATNDMIDCLNDITATCILELFQNNTTILYADRILKETGRIDAEKAMKNRVASLPSNNFINTYLGSYVNDPIQKMKLPETAHEAPRGFVRAKIALDEGRYSEIIAACTEELENSESESQYKVEALLLRGTFHLLSGAFDEANKDLDEVINNESVDKKLRTYAYIRRASLRVQMENRTECFADFDAAEQLQPDNPDIYHQRAQINILLDQMPEALKQFEEAVRLAPNHAMAHVQKLYADYRVALLSSNQLRLLQVMSEFQKTVERFPDYVECHSLLAQVLSDQQQFAQADQSYEKALKMAPGNASLYVHRAIMMLQWKGDVEGCISLMNKALEVDEKCELVYETIGTLEVQRANLNRAVELFEKAISLAKSRGEMAHLFALRNAALAQIYVQNKLGLDMSRISPLNSASVPA